MGTIRALLLRFVCGSAVILGLLACLHQALQVQQAELYYESARGKSGVERLIALDRALQRQPGAYDYLLAKARTEAAIGRHRSAYGTLLEALQARPSWPYAWDELLQWHVAQNDYSPSFALSLERSSTLGQHLDQLVWQRVRVAFATYGQVLDPASRQRLAASLQRGLHHQRDKVLGTAIFLQRPEIICKSGWVEITKELTSWCRNAELFIRVCLREPQRPMRKAVVTKCNVGRRYWWRELQRPFRLKPELESAPE